MSFEADLKTHYSDVRRRLNPPPISGRDHNEALDRLQAQIKNLNSQLWESAARIRELEKELAGSAVGPMPSMRRILFDTAAYFDIGAHDVLSHHRNWSVVLPRQIAMYFCKTLTLFSLPAIGRFFDDRDHTTVLHSVRKITAARKVDAKLDQDLRVLEKIIKAEPALVAAE